MSDDIVDRIANRLNDAPMPTERLLDEANDEIKRLRVMTQRIAEQFGANASTLNDDDELERAIMAYGNDWARAARNAALEEAAKVMDAAAKNAVAKRDEYRKRDPKFAYELQWWSNVATEGAAAIRELKGA